MVIGPIGRQPVIWSHSHKSTGYEPKRAQLNHSVRRSMSALEADSMSVAAICASRVCLHTRRMFAAAQLPRDAPSQQQSHLIECERSTFAARHRIN
jgi:hypothetical protein